MAKLFRRSGGIRPLPPAPPPEPLEAALSTTPPTTTPTRPFGTSGTDWTTPEAVKLTNWLKNDLMKIASGGSGDFRVQLEEWQRNSPRDYQQAVYDITSQFLSTPGQSKNQIATYQQLQKESEVYLTKEAIKEGQPQAVRYAVDQILAGKSDYQEAINTLKSTNPELAHKVIYGSATDTLKTPGQSKEQINNLQKIQKESEVFLTNKAVERGEPGAIRFAYERNLASGGKEYADAVGRHAAANPEESAKLKKEISQAFAETPGQSKEQATQLAGITQEATQNLQDIQSKQRQATFEEKLSAFRKEYETKRETAISDLEKSLTTQLPDWIAKNIAPRVKEQMNQLGILYSGATPTVTERLGAEKGLEIQQMLGGLRMGTQEGSLQLGLQGLLSTLEMERERAFTNMNLELMRSQNALMSNLTKVGKPNFLGNLAEQMLGVAGVGFGGYLGGRLGAAAGGGIADIIKSIFKKRDAIPGLTTPRLDNNTFISQSLFFYFCLRISCH